MFAARSFLKSDGSTWTWGINTSGQIGDNSITNRSSPVSTVGAHSFIKLAGGSDMMIGLKADGSVWAWGLNTSGQVGDNTATNRSSPVSVVGGHSFFEITCAASTAFARKADGSIWAWGSNTNGIIGDNSATNRSSPVSILSTTGGTSIVVKAVGEIMAGDRLFHNLNSGGPVLATDRIDLIYFG
jgi:alpha-tubulin suppressor-like RCC1 family protein